MMKLKKVFAIFAMSLMMLTASPVLVSADIGDEVDPLGLAPIDATGLGKKDIRVTIASIIKTAMGLLGIVAVVIILIGGFKWMTAGGNEEGTEEGKKYIFSGIIGLAIILSAYALASYVITSLITATT